MEYAGLDDRYPQFSLNGVIPVSVRSPSEIVICKPELEESHNEQMWQMTDHYLRNMEKIGSVRRSQMVEGQTVAFRRRSDGMWYRGEMRFLDGVRRIYFVDAARFMEENEFNLLRPLRKKYLDLPPRYVKLAVAGVRPTLERRYTTNDPQETAEALEWGRSVGGAILRYFEIGYGPMMVLNQRPIKDVLMADILFGSTSVAALLLKDKLADPCFQVSLFPTY